MSDSEKLAALYDRAAALSKTLAGGGPFASKEKLAAVAASLGWRDVEVTPNGVIGDEPIIVGNNIGYYSADQHFPNLPENLASLILISALQKKEWVNIGDRIPSESGFYLTFDTYSESLPIKLNRFNTPYWQTNHSTVTHWQPLPTPPRI